jgi:hypothetical protein
MRHIGQVGHLDNRLAAGSANLYVASGFAWYVKGIAGSDRRLRFEVTARRGGNVMAEHTPYQKKVIKRYYENEEALCYQKLSELPTEIYLAEGKKLDKLWEQAAGALGKLGVPQTRIDQIVGERDPALLAEIVKELSRRETT